MNLKFKSLEARNILALGPVGKIINFSDYEGKTVLIIGQNHTGNTVRSNGSGKSTIFESLFWTLFGESYRPLKYSDEIINLKSDTCSGVITFEIDNQLFEVYRSKIKGKSPGLRIYQNEEEILIDSDTKSKQEQLEKILGYNADSFTTSIMFHQDFTAFPDLKPAERAKMLTDISNLEKWDKGIDEAKRTSKIINDQIQLKILKIFNITEIIKTIQEVNYQVKEDEFEEERSKNIIKFRKDLLTVKSNNENSTLSYKKELIDIAEDIDIINENKNRLNQELDSLISEFPEELKNENEANIRDLATLNADLNSLRRTLGNRETQLEKFNKIKGGTCPTCLQIVGPESVESVISSLVEEKSNILTQIEEKHSATKLSEALSAVIKGKIETANKELNSRRINLSGISQLEIRLTERKGRKSTIDSILQKIGSVLTEQINSLRERIESENIKVNPFTKMKEDQIIKIQEKEKERIDTEKEIVNLKGEFIYKEFWVTGFKRIKMMLFDEMVGRLQELSQDNLNQFYSELTLKISGERQTKSGNMRDEIHISIERDEGEVSYAAYSGGERQMIKLSVSLALAQVINELCDRKCNTLFFDEPNNDLDDIGKQVNFKVFSDLASEGRCVIVIDHDNNFQDMFNEVITVVKKDGFATIN